MRTNIKGVAPEWYELESERDKPDPVGFYLSPLDGFGRSDISMLSLSSRSGARNAPALASSAVIKLAFQLGVKGWQNIEDADNPGEKLPFSSTAMASIHHQWILEVGARVLQISDMGAEESKNSDSPSS